MRRARLTAVVDVDPQSSVTAKWRREEASPRPEELLGEWGVRDVTPPSQDERADVEADLDLNPLVGKPLRRRLRNFITEADAYLASLGGPLPYMGRLREIERLTEQPPR